MYNQKGTIFNIQRFSTSDGPGIRSVVFLKGCPLNCAWCHNPESKNQKPEILYNRELCIGCGKCIKTCKNSCHSFEERHIFNRNLCLSCNECAATCPSKALEVCGREASVSDVIEIVARDIPFYEESGGGITISGGEPLMQYDFTLELLKSSKELGINTAIETCGFTNKNIEELNRYTDLWLYDIKLFENSKHIKYTGVSNDVIFNNLYALDKINSNIILRCPIIPDINTSAEHFDNIAILSNNLKNVKAIHLEMYHPLGISKAEQLNQKQAYTNNTFLNSSDILPLYHRLQGKTEKEVIIL